MEKTVAVGPTKHILEQWPCRCKLEGRVKLVVQNPWPEVQVPRRSNENTQNWVYMHPNSHWKTTLKWVPQLMEGEPTKCNRKHRLG